MTMRMIARRWMIPATVALVASLSTLPAFARDGGRDHRDRSSQGDVNLQLRLPNVFAGRGSSDPHYRAHRYDRDDRSYNEQSYNPRYGNGYDNSYGYNNGYGYTNGYGYNNDQYYQDGRYDGGNGYQFQREGDRQWNQDRHRRDWDRRDWDRRDENRRDRDDRGDRD